MAPPEKDRKLNLDEIEVAYYTKELGRTLQRKMLQRRLDDLTESGKSTSSAAASASHGDEIVPNVQLAPPREDRAG
jgi:hypothetical protein